MQIEPFFQYISIFYVIHTCSSVRDTSHFLLVSFPAPLHSSPQHVPNNMPKTQTILKASGSRAHTFPNMKGEMPAPKTVPCKKPAADPPVEVPPTDKQKLILQRCPLHRLQKHYSYLANSDACLHFMVTYIYAFLFCVIGFFFDM